MNQTFCLLVLCLSVCVVFSSVDKKDEDEPKVFNYAVFEQSSGNYCIVLQAGVRLDFNFTIEKNKTKAFSVDLEVPGQNGTFKNVSGTCGNQTQSITLPLILLEGSNVTLQFNRTDTKNKDIILASVVVNYREDNSTLFPGANATKTFTARASNLSEWNTPDGQGYWCSKSEEVDFSKQNLSLTKIQFSNMKVEAFRSKNDTKFDMNKYTQCEQDNEIGNIVPIAVGAALGALVLIVLIAYLVGRKRNIRGYESV